MADGFGGFEDRYKLKDLELNVISKKGSDGDDSEIASPGSWLADPARQPLSSFNPFRVADFTSKGRIVRINTDLYKELFGNTAADGEMLYQKRPARIVVRHYNRKWWNPLTRDKTFYVSVLTGRVAPKRFPGGVAGQYVSTIGFNNKMMPALQHRTDPKTNYVSLSVTAMNTPLWTYVIGATPSESWNLSVLFFWLSAFYGLVGEGYKWPDHTRHFLDSVGSQIIKLASTFVW